MIIEFSVKNFRSFKDEQTFSLYTQTKGNSLLSENSILCPNTRNLRVLKSAGVYGANASGKSNLLIAIDILCFIVTGSKNFDEVDGIRGFDPYRLSLSSEKNPVSLSIEFVSKKQNRFRYAVSFTRNQIRSERLEYNPSGRWVKLFSRKPSGAITFAKTARSGIQQIPFFPNQCYLSVAALSAATSETIRDAYMFFKRGASVMYIGKDDRFPLYPNIQSALPKISSFIQFADTGVEKISVEKRAFPPKHSFPPEFPDEVKVSFQFDAEHRSVFYHRGENGVLSQFDFYNESEGTQRLFNRLPLIFDVLTIGGILIIDELENSLHPFICELLVRLFNDPETNPLGAQLIFSTHDVSLLSKNLLTPEQVWFTEKKNGATTLFSLADFKDDVTAESPIAHWYEEGRFGAFPNYNWHKIKQLFAGGAQNGKEK